jgi:predicted phosphoadenosine phosphosulfate sulfurtransferase
MEAPNKLDRIWRNPDGTFKSGHPQSSQGRPKGKTLKEYAREYLMALPDDQKSEYLASLPADIVWKMAEGLPQQDVTSGGEAIIPAPLINYAIRDNNSNKQNTGDVQEVESGAGGNISKQDSINTDLPNLASPTGQDTNAN